MSAAHPLLGYIYFSIGAIALLCTASLAFSDFSSNSGAVLFDGGTLGTLLISTTNTSRQYRSNLSPPRWHRVQPIQRCHPDPLRLPCAPACRSRGTSSLPCAQDCFPGSRQRQCHYCRHVDRRHAPPSMFYSIHLASCWGSCADIRPDGSTPSVKQDSNNNKCSSRSRQSQTRMRLALEQRHLLQPNPSSRSAQPRHIASSPNRRRLNSMDSCND